MSDSSKPFEKSETPEKRLVRLFKERGPEDKEAIELLDSWTREQERQVANMPRATIEFNLRRGRLYLAAGYTDEAFENFEAARLEAWSENNERLYTAIGDEMDRLGI